MAGLELCLCKHNLPPCIQSLSSEGLLQECKSYLEGLLATQQPEALSKAGLPAVPGSTNSGSSDPEKDMIKAGKEAQETALSLLTGRTKAATPHSPAHTLCKGVQTGKHRPAGISTCGSWQQLVAKQIPLGHLSVGTRGYTTIW